MCVCVLLLFFVTTGGLHGLSALCHAAEVQAVAIAHAPTLPLRMMEMIATGKAVRAKRATVTNVLLTADGASKCAMALVFV